MLTHPTLLVVDEIGYLSVNQDGTVLGDDVMAAALIDRLVHHCYIVNIWGNSYRMRDHQNLLQSGSGRRRKRAAA